MKKLPDQDKKELLKEISNVEEAIEKKIQQQKKKNMVMQGEN